MHQQKLVRVADSTHHVNQSIYDTTTRTATAGFIVRELFLVSSLKILHWGKCQQHYCMVYHTAAVSFHIMMTHAALVGQLLCTSYINVYIECKGGTIILVVNDLFIHYYYYCLPNLLVLQQQKQLLWCACVCVWHVIMPRSMHIYTWSIPVN